MKLRVIPMLVSSVLLVSVPVQAGEFSSHHPYLAGSSFYSAPSLLSSAVISGIILLPVLIPAQLVVISVQHSEKDKTTTITGTTQNNEKAALIVATEKLENKAINPGDVMTLEPAETGTGAYLKKDGTIISHMVSPADEQLLYPGKRME
ncbi:STM0539 family protein [Morganella morganii]|uniref:STM0539 family protein n=1 Tax=Morganella morganii TaxID=582 RepID=UPI00339C8254